MPVDFVIPVDAGEGHITILPLAIESVGQGTWSTSVVVENLLNLNCRNDTNADGDNISFKVYLAAGTYTLGFLAYTKPGRGIVDFDIDGVEIASFDLYDDPGARNVWFTDTGNVISTPGLKTLKLRVDGRHGSAIDYYADFIVIILWRTA